MEFAALWISIVAAAAGVASALIAWFARRDALKAQTQATIAQKEAALAEGRSAAASETIARIQTQIFHGPPWTVEWFDGDTYIITNNSPVDALDVDVDGQPDDVTVRLSDTSPRFVGARSAFKFMFSRSLSTGWEQDVVVKWRREGSDEVLTWRHPIPPRPST